jgi:hypothetical protein
MRDYTMVRRRPCAALRCDDMLVDTRPCANRSCMQGWQYVNNPRIAASQLILVNYKKEIVPSCMVLNNINRRMVRVVASAAVGPLSTVAYAHCYMRVESDGRTWFYLAEVMPDGALTGRGMRAGGVSADFAKIVGGVIQKNPDGSTVYLDMAAFNGNDVSPIVFYDGMGGAVPLETRMTDGIYLVIPAASNPVDATLPGAIIQCPGGTIGLYTITPFY